MTGQDPLSKLIARLRGQATKWRQVRLELDVALLSLDGIIWMAEELPRILMSLQAARHQAAELVANLETMAAQLEEGRKTTEWRG